MNKFYSFSVFAVAFALVFGLGVIKATASDSYNVTPDQANIFGLDEADKGANVLRDRDVGQPDISFQSFGLMGDWSGEH